MVIIGRPDNKEVNLARGKHATQSSTYFGTGEDQSASRGVDGIMAPGKDPVGMFITNADANPWWQVDLGASHRLTRLRIFNRVGPDVVGRSRTIEALTSADGASWTSVHSHDGTPRETLDIDLSGMTARYVKLQLRERTHFHLFEVEVFGYETSGR